MLAPLPKKESIRALRLSAFRLTAKGDPISHDELYIFPPLEDLSAEGASERKNYTRQNYASLIGAVDETFTLSVTRYLQHMLQL